jgi:antitoxin component YwqK of YwqJK toxin-antitoxin module
LDTLIQEGDVFFAPETMEPYSGPIFRPFPQDTSVIQIRGVLEDGRYEGWVERYVYDFAIESSVGAVVENGAVLSERVSYSNGVRHGWSETYELSRGQSMSRTMYSNGRDAGRGESYNDDGQLVAKRFLVEGESAEADSALIQLEGYGDNGALSYRWFYRSGGGDPHQRKHGKEERYWDNGVLGSTISWVEGVKDGVEEQYYEDGQLQMRSVYSNGLAHGPSLYNNEDGSVHSRGVYSAGEECGEWIWWGEPKTYPPCPEDLEENN